MYDVKFTFSDGVTLNYARVTDIAADRNNQTAHLEKPLAQSISLVGLTAFYMKSDNGNHSLSCENLRAIDITKSG